MSWRISRRTRLSPTGFYRLGVWDDEPDDKRMALFEELDDVIVSTSAAFLGITMVAPAATITSSILFPKETTTNSSPSSAMCARQRMPITLRISHYSPLASAEKISNGRRKQQAQIKPLEEELAGATTEEDKKKLKERNSKVKEAASPFDWALSVRESGSKPVPTHILVRGNAATPGAEVKPAFLAVLGGQKPDLPPQSEEAQSTGRRLALAKWIAVPKIL